MLSSGYQTPLQHRHGLAPVQDGLIKPGTRCRPRQPRFSHGRNHLGSGNALAQLVARIPSTQNSNHRSSRHRLDHLDRPSVPEILPQSGNRRNSKLRSLPNQKRNETNVRFLIRTEKPTLRRATPLRGKSPPQQWRSQPRQPQPQPWRSTRS